MQAKGRARPPAHFPEATLEARQAAQAAADALTTQLNETAGAQIAATKVS